MRAHEVTEVQRKGAKGCGERAKRERRRGVERSEDPEAKNAKEKQRSEGIRSEGSRESSLSSNRANRQESNGGRPQGSEKKEKRRRLRASHRGTSVGSREPGRCLVGAAEALGPLVQVRSFITTDDPAQRNGRADRRREGFHHIQHLDFKGNSQRSAVAFPRAWGRHLTSVSQAATQHVALPPRGHGAHARDALCFSMMWVFCGAGGGLQERTKHPDTAATARRPRRRSAPRGRCRTR